MAEAMISKGKSKYRRKIPSMQSNYKDAEDRAKDHYAKVGFKSARVDAYKTAWTDMPSNYVAKVKPGLEDKWADNWKAKMF